MAPRFWGLNNREVEMTLAEMLTTLVGWEVGAWFQPWSAGGWMQHLEAQHWQEVNIWVNKMQTIRTKMWDWVISPGGTMYIKKRTGFLRNITLSWSHGWWRITKKKSEKEQENREEKEGVLSRQKEKRMCPYSLAGVVRGEAADPGAGMGVLTA